MQRLGMICLGLVGLFSSSVAKAASFNDTTSDFSNNKTAPTPIALDVGSNTITGSTGTQNGTDLDFFTFTIPAGQKLTAIQLSAFDGPSVSFIGVQAGGTVTSLNSASNLLGYLHFGTSFIGTDVLDDIGRGPGAIDFTGPLGPGQYTFWIQENGTPLVHYTFNFQVAAASVPAMPPLATAGAAMALLLGAALILRSAGKTAG